MRYYANPSTPRVRDAMTKQLIGCIVTWRQRLSIPEGALVCADNNCFGDSWPGGEVWWEWLAALAQRQALQFAVAPDVVADAAATLARSSPWLPRMRELGVPVAYVAQDGIESTEIPWAAFEVLFIGGSTEFKLGTVARALTLQAHTLGKRVHMGRVNSLRRMQYAHAIGCDSTDGTLIAHGPDEYLPQVLGWLRQVNGQHSLFGGHV